MSSCSSGESGYDVGESMVHYGPRFIDSPPSDLNVRFDGILGRLVGVVVAFYGRWSRGSAASATVEVRRGKRLEGIESCSLKRLC